MIEVKEVLKGIGISDELINRWADPLSDAFKIYDISNEKRIAAFLSQVLVESGNFKWLEENLNYSAKGLLTTFPKYFNVSQAKNYERKPQAIASRVYGNRMGNGDEKSGDGWKYRGRGLIQLTGKSNYQKFDVTVSDNIIDNPDLVKTPKYAVLSACWFWDINNLNDLADAGNIVGMSRKVNGGDNHLDERVDLYNRIMKVYDTKNNESKKPVGK